MIDVTDPATYDPALDGVGTVVVCFDQDDVTFAESCLERGIDYVDVSPTDALLRQIESFDETAREHDATGVLSVGLSPGLTNLFVADALDGLDTVSRADNTLLLGLGEAFGPDTIKWTLEDASGAYTVQADGKEKHIRAFTEPRKVEIPQWGQRRAYRANLADQHVLVRTTEIPAVATRLCYDSRLVTTCLAVLSYTRLYEPLTSVIGVLRLFRLVDSLPFGAAESVVMTEVTGTVDAQEIRFTHWSGPDQARATGTVAASVVQSLLTTSQPAGVHHIHQVFSLEEVSHQLAEVGYALGNTKTTNPRV